jgi:hypothetical protein
MTAHTPGPWEAVEGRSRLSIKAVSLPTYDAGSLPTIAVVSSELCGAEANARLIAAAPELLEKLRNAVRIVDFYMKSLGVEPRDIVESLAPARAAIAKAEGRAA